eukprot:gene5904-4219_t
MAESQEDPELIPKKLSKWMQDMNTLHHDPPALPTLVASSSRTTTPPVVPTAGGQMSWPGIQPPLADRSSVLPGAVSPWEHTAKDARFSERIKSLELTMSALSTPQLRSTRSSYREPSVSARTPAGRRFLSSRSPRREAEASPSLPRAASTATQLPVAGENPPGRASPQAKRPARSSLRLRSAQRCNSASVDSLLSCATLAQNAVRGLEAATEESTASIMRLTPRSAAREERSKRCVSVLPMPLRLLLAIVIIAMFHLLMLYCFGHLLLVRRAQLTRVEHQKMELEQRKLSHHVFLYAPFYAISCSVHQTPVREGPILLSLKYDVVVQMCSQDKILCASLSSLVGSFRPECCGTLNPSLFHFYFTSTFPFLFLAAFSFRTATPQSKNKNRENHRSIPHLTPIFTMQNDTYEKFMGRVFCSPDLMKITEFNTEIQSVMATRLGLLPTGKEKKRSYVDAPVLRIPRSVPPKPKVSSEFQLISDGTDSGPRRKNVDELDDYESLKALLHPRPTISSPIGRSFTGEDASPLKGAGSPVTTVSSPARSGRTMLETMGSIFDTNNSVARLSDTRARSVANFPEDAIMASKLEPSAKGHHSHRKDKGPAKHLRPLLSEGILLQNIQLQYCTASMNAINSVVFTSATDDTYIASGGLPYIFLRQLRHGRREPLPLSIIDNDDSPIHHVARSEDVSLLATSGDDGRLCLFDLITLQRIAIFSHPGAVTCSAFAPNSRYIVTGCVDSKCRLWGTKPSVSGTEMATYCGLQDRVTAIAFQTVGGLVASGSQSGEVHIWSASTTERVHAIAERTLKSKIIGLSFGWSGEILLAADKDHVLFSEVSTGAPLKMLVTGDWVAPLACRGLHENGVSPCFTFAEFAPKATFPNYFFVGKGDNTVMLYEYKLEKMEAPKEKNNQRTANARTLDLKIMDEIWSTKIRAPAVCACPGIGYKMILGDAVGNGIILTLEPSAYFTNLDPPPRTPLRVHLPNDLQRAAPPPPTCSSWMFSPDPPPSLPVFLSSLYRRSVGGQNTVKNGSRPRQAIRSGPISLPSGNAARTSRSLCPPPPPGGMEGVSFALPLSKAPGSSPAERKAASASAIILCNQEHTYTCEPGDVRPRQSPLPPLTAAGLDGFVARVVNSERRGRRGPRGEKGDDASTGSDGGAAPGLLAAAAQLHPLLKAKHVVAVVPLAAAATPSYLEHLALFLCHPLVGASSLVLVSDVVASAAAVGRTGSVLVLQATAHCCTIAYVSEGCSTRYSSCRWERLWTARQRGSAANSPQTAEVLAEFFGSAAVSGLSGAPSCDQVLDGKLELLLGRLYRPELSRSVLLAGEALQDPVVYTLLRKVVEQGPKRIPSASTASPSVGEKRRDRSDATAAGRRKKTKAEAESEEDSGGSSSGSDASASGSSSSSADESSEGEASDSDETEAESGAESSEAEAEAPASTLTLLPSCSQLPPWWLPLIGASIVGQLADRDVRTMSITPKEVADTSGSIVRWKALI